MKRTNAFDQEISSTVTYLSVLLLPKWGPIQNGLYDVFVCVKERHQENDRGKKQRERGRASASERKRGSEREKERTTVSRSTYHHHSCQCPSHYLRHRTIIISCVAGNAFFYAMYTAPQDFYLIKYQIRSNGPQIQ